MAPLNVELLVEVWIALCLLAAAASFGLGFRRALRGRRAVALPAPEVPVPAAEVAVPEPVPEAVPEPFPEPPDLRSRLGKTRSALVGRIESLLSARPELDAETLEEVEAILFGADLGVRTAEELLEAARAAGSQEELKATLESRAQAILGERPA